MNRKMQNGMDVARIGMQAVGLGRKAWEMKQKLPGEKKKAEQKALGKAWKAEEKRRLRLEKKLRRRKRTRLSMRKVKGLGRVALALRRKYF